MRSSTGVPNEVAVSVEHMKQKETQDTAQENIFRLFTFINESHCI